MTSMSNIKSYGNTSHDNLIHKLKYYINKVLTATGETDDGITWYICASNELPHSIIPLEQFIDSITQMQVASPTDFTLGKYSEYSKEVWITTYAIGTAPDPILEKLNQHINSNTISRFGDSGETQDAQNSKPNQLIKAIICALAHLKEHGDYTALLEKYKNA